MPFVRTHAAFALALAFVVFGLHILDLHPLVSPWWSFTGLSVLVRPALDLLPIVPWFGAVLLGVTAAKVLRLQAKSAGPLIRCLGWPGRHSLSIYLIHQPFILGVLWVAVQIGLLGN